eukprot:SAG31_NODE_3_length_45830_cov_42.279701_26_plen_82_part_00
MAGGVKQGDGPGATSGVGGEQRESLLNANEQDQGRPIFDRSLGLELRGGGGGGGGGGPGGGGGGGSGGGGGGGGGGGRGRP